MGFLIKENLRMLSFIVGIILMGVMINKAFFSKEEKIEQYVNNSKEKNFQGIIEEKIIDKANHSWTYVIFNNNEKIHLTSKLYDKLKIDDSIIKIKGELFVTIYRNATSFKLDYFSGETLKTEK